MTTSLPTMPPCPSRDGPTATYPSPAYRRWTSMMPPAAIWSGGKIARWLCCGVRTLNLMVRAGSEWRVAFPRRRSQSTATSRAGGGWRSLSRRSTASVVSSAFSSISLDENSTSSSTSSSSTSSSTSFQSAVGLQVGSAVGLQVGSAVGSAVATGCSVGRPVGADGSSSLGSG